MSSECRTFFWGGGHPNPAVVRTLGGIVSLIIVVVVANQRTKDGDFSSHFVRTDSKSVKHFRGLCVNQSFMVDAIKVVTKYLVCDFSRAGVFQGFKMVFDIISEMTHTSEWVLYK